MDRQESTPKRAVLYARVSGDDRGQEGRNLNGQLDMCRDYAQKNGWLTKVELTEDERGASGARFDLPELNRALEMAKAGEFDVLVTRELDRFARGLAKQLIVESEFRRAGVQVEYVLGAYPDTPEGNLNKNIRAVIAEFERLKIIERTKRGMRAKIKAGNVLACSAIPFGYRNVIENGRHILQIYEPEARIVRMIFIWYTKGDESGHPMSIIAIAERLTQMKVKTTGDKREDVPKKRGVGEWAYSTIADMLKNETYAGKWWYGKTKLVNGVKVDVPKSEWIGLDVPAIVDRDTWEQAQARRQENKRKAKRNRKYDYLLSGSVHCGACGSRMYGYSVNRGEHTYYRCAGKSKITYNVCDAPYFPRDQVDTVVWEWVKSFLIDPINLQKGLDLYLAERDQEMLPLQERLEVVGDLVSENREQLERLLDLYLAGEFAREMLLDRKKRLEDTIAALEKERAVLSSQLEAQTLTSDQMSTIREFASQVAQELSTADEDFSQRRQIIETLNVQTTLVVVVYLNNTDK